MANKHHIEILKQGIASWNLWRSKTKEVPDFRDADLNGIDLERPGLANSKSIDFTNAIFTDANLSNSRLRGADFTLASMYNAKLINADLRETYFHSADLSRADLTDADIRGADFTRANLINVNLTNAKLQYTGLDFVNLSSTIGLNSCQHYGPSDIGFRTLTESPNLPTNFLRGCGLSDRLIENLPSLTQEAIQFFDCFISYSHMDKIFADFLFEELQKRGIRCWKDDHSILLGENILDAVDGGVRMSKKLLLICSNASLESKWVKDEIDKALEKERNMQKEFGKNIIVLVPITIDDYFLKWIDGRATMLRTRLFGDFCSWQTKEEFDKGLKLLINSLRGKNSS